MLVVSVRERGKEEHPFTFDKDTIVIGRLRVNDVILPKRNISKKHAVLELVEGEVRLTDMGSTNGTYLNGKRAMEPVVVSPVDKIFVGDYIIQIRLEDSKSAIDGKVVPLETPSPELEARSTMQDLDGSMLEAELEKLGVEPVDVSGPETQILDPDDIPAVPPDDLEFDMPTGLGEENEPEEIEPEENEPEEIEESPEIFEESADLELEYEEASSDGLEGEELFEVPLEEEELDEPVEVVGLAPSPPAVAKTLATADMPAVHMAVVRDDEDDFDKDIDLGPLTALLMNPELRDALINPDGSIIARDYSGNRIPNVEGFIDGDALADLAERLAGFEGVELGVISRRVPGMDAWLSLVFPPVSSDGIVASLRPGSHAPVPISSLAKSGTMSKEQAKEFVRALTSSSNVLITGPNTDGMTQLLAAGLGMLPGKPRYVALGAGVPRLGGDGDLERIEMGIDYAVEEPEAFMEALDLLQPRWIVAGPCSGRPLLGLLAIAVTAQVPLLATVRLPDPKRLVDVLLFADRRENGVLGSQGIARMLDLADPLILAVDEGGKVNGLYGADMSTDTGAVEILGRD